MSLTDKDSIILCCLVQNPEITLSEIGNLVNLSHVSVRSRLNKMFAKNIIQKRLLINPKMFDLEIILVLIKSENKEKKENLLRTYKKCPRVFFLSTTIDYYDMFLGVIAEDRAISELLSSNDFCLLRFPEIAESEIIYQENLIKPLFLPILFPIGSANTSVTPCNETCIKCDKYRHRICVGCPKVKEYRGRLLVNTNQYQTDINTPYQVG